MCSTSLACLIFASLVMMGEGFVMTPSRPCSRYLSASPTTSGQRISRLGVARWLPEPILQLTMQREEQLFPVLSRIAGGVWEGEMRYAGAQLEAVPLVLHGTTTCTLLGKSCTIESSITFPNGKTRVVAMRGEQTAEAGKSFRLDPVDDAGPIYTRIAELAPDTVLLQEYNKTDERVVLTSSISLVQGAQEELVQVAHEMSDQAGVPAEGFQVWRMRRHVER